MKLLDIETWKRKKHYEYFKEVDYPHFNLTGNLDITKFLNTLKQYDLNFFNAVVYCVSKVANENEAFRLRIRDEAVVIHDVVDPTFTVLMEDETYSFCEVPYDFHYTTFNKACTSAILKVKANAVLEDEVGRDDYLFITSIPWFSFTSIVHPVQMSPVDSVPRISWGKYFKQGPQILLPMSVQVHHGLVDGIDVAKFMNRLQICFDEFESFLKES